jgi:hypothetical protein
LQWGFLLWARIEKEIFNYLIADMNKLLTICLVLAADYSFAQTLQTVTSQGNTTTNSITIGNGSNHTASLNIARGPVNQVNVTHEGSTTWGLLLGFGDGSYSGNYHGLNHAAVINVQNGPLHLGTNNDSKLTLLPNGNLGLGVKEPGAKLSIIKDGTAPGGYDDGKTLFVTGTYGSGQAYDGGVEFRHDNLSQGIGFGYNTIYQTGYNVDQELNLIGKGNGNITLNAVGGASGNVGIGTTDTRNYKLAVNGNIRAKEIKVEATPWPDYVFNSSYKLPSLSETELFIKENHHLPQIPSAAEVEKEGISLGEMNAKLLKKIEELTLHLIEQNKQIDLQGKQLKEQFDLIQSQQQEINKIKNSLHD